MGSLQLACHMTRVLSCCISFSKIAGSNVQLPWKQLCNLWKVEITCEAFFEDSPVWASSRGNMKIFDTALSEVQLAKSWNYSIRNIICFGMKFKQNVPFSLPCGKQYFQISHRWEGEDLIRRNFYLDQKITKSNGQCWEIETRGKCNCFNIITEGIGNSYSVLNELKIRYVLASSNEYNVDKIVIFLLQKVKLLY